MLLGVNYFMEYDKMLERLYAELPESTKKHERFIMPQAESFIQGHKTIVKNFVWSDISQFSEMDDIFTLMDAITGSDFN